MNYCLAQLKHVIKRITIKLVHQLSATRNEKIDMQIDVLTKEIHQLKALKCFNHNFKI